MPPADRFVLRKTHELGRRDIKPSELAELLPTTVSLKARCCGAGYGCGGCPASSGIGGPSGMPRR
jgi:hypothetical protein